MQSICPGGRIGLSRDLPSQPVEHFRLHFEHHTGARRHCALPVEVWLAMTKAAPQPGAPSVQQVARQLTELCASIKAFRVEDKVYVPPIIDRNDRYYQDILPGLAKFSQTCQKEAEWVNEVRV